MPKTVSINVRVSEETKAKLKAIAAERGGDIRESHVVRGIIEEFLAKQGLRI